MNDQQIIEKAKELAIELFAEKLGLECEIDVSIEPSDSDRRYILITVEGEDLGVLIGQRGVNVEAFQTILSLMLKKETGEWNSVFVDINGYREKRKRNITDIALKAMQQVVDFDVEVSLRPMSPADRRLVHMALANEEKVETESQGFGEDRHLIIRPAGA